MLFVDGSARFTKGRNQNHMADEDIAVDDRRLPHRGRPRRRRRRASPPGRARRDQGQRLGPQHRPLLEGVGAEAVDVATALAELAEAQEELRQAEERLAERLKAAGYA